MANSNRVDPKAKKETGAPSTVTKKRERRAVSHTSSITSLTVLRERLQHLTRWIFIGLGVVLVLGFGLVSAPNLRGRDADQAGGDVATINGKVIEREQFEAAVRQMKNSPYAAYMGSGPTSDIVIRSMLLEQETDRILKLEAARKERNKVGRQQVKDRIEQAVDSNIQQLKSYYKTEKDFKEKVLKREKVANEEQLRKKLRNGVSREWIQAMREQILIENLERKIRAQAGTLPIDKVKPEDLETRVRQILIKTEKRSDAEAQKLAQQVLDEVKAGANFAKVAKARSEDDYTKAQSGDMGWLGKGQFWQGPELEQAAMALKPGQVSGLVKTSAGYHILKVEGQRYSATKHWNEYAEGLKKKAKIVVKDPILQAYKQLSAEAKDDAARKQNRVKAIALFEKGVNDTYNPDTRAAAYYTIGQLHEQDKQTAKAAEAYGKAVEAMPSPEIFRALGDAQRALKQDEAALKNYKTASEMATDSASQQHYFVHMMLQQAYTEMNQPKLAAAEKAWIDAYMQSQSGMGMPGGGAFTVR